jgi:hypothetical protein
MIPTVNIFRTKNKPASKRPRTIRDTGFFVRRKTPKAARTQQPPLSGQSSSLVDSDAIWSSGMATKLGANAKMSQKIVIPDLFVSSGLGGGWISSLIENNQYENIDTHPRKNEIRRFNMRNSTPNTIDQMVPRRRSMKEDAKQQTTAKMNAAGTTFLRLLALLYFAKTRIAAEGTNARNSPAILTQPRPSVCF